MRKLLIFLLLALPAFSQTVNTNFYPAQTGLSLGRNGQRWNLYANNLDITGTITVNGAAGSFTLSPLFGSGHYAASTDLLSITPGHCAIWLIGNMLGDLPCTGTGDLLSTPVFSQAVNQPTVSGVRTSFNPNVQNDTVFLNQADTTLNWSKSPTTPATLAAGSTVITLATCPKGLSAKDHYVYIAGTGTPEIAQITAASCTADATSGTITVTVANSHSAGYTIGTASSGLKEASEYAFNTFGNAYVGGGRVSIATGTPLTLRGTTYIEAYNQTIDFQNVEVDISADYATYSCGLHIGDTTAAGGTVFQNITLLNATGFRPTVAGAGGICLHSQGTHITDLSALMPVPGNYWEHFLIVKNDQSAVIDKMDAYANGGGTRFWGNCTAEDCSSIIYGPGGASAGILHIKELQMTLGDKANGIDWLNGNTLQIDHAILQNMAQFGIRTKTTFGDNSNLTIGSIYFENVGTANPTGLGGAAIIAQNGVVTIQNNILQGSLPRYANTGATVFLYYVVPIDASSNHGSPLLAGYATLTTTGTHAVKWYNVSPGGSYDVIRIQASSPTIAPYTANCAGGTVNACGSVATAQAAGTVCDANNVCSFTDDIAVATTSYTVVSAAFFPKIDFWPGTAVSSPLSATTVATTATGKFFFPQLPTVSFTAGGLVSPFGALNTAFFAQRCSGGSAYASIGVSCASSASTIAAGFWLRPETNGVGGRQGIINTTMPYGQSFVTSDIWTLKSKSPDFLFANQQFMLHPAWEDTDDAIGYETASSGGTYIRGGNSVRMYVGKVPDNAPQWKITATGVTTPLAITSTLATGTSPFVVASTTPVANLTLTNHPLVYSCGTTTTCAATAQANPIVAFGIVTLSGGTATVASLPTFTSTSSFRCTASDNTAIATGANAVPASTTSITVTGTGTDVVSYICVGR